MLIFWLAVVCSPLIMLLSYWHFGDPVGEIAAYGSAEWLTLIGTMLSYVGIVTSAYAVIKIGELTRRHYARTRLPQLQISLIKTCDQMSTFSGTANELMSEKFVAGVPALSRALRRVNDEDIAKLARAAIKAQSKLVKWAADSGNGEILMASEPRYWAVLGILNELSVEVSERIKEEKAAR
ncbi:hypothetical protein [Agrobacterium sp. YIC 4121]|uniref:hypothetical protein n=1 Tax=Agrobacterium sp. YIC 4121 TaxID=1923829 RepID=UPI00098E9293|nr:hypothetical protein [Agrobacterium sp. YIC 4121]OOO29129.1 hypothetical protein BTE54_17645 [Agrobacterium sp. YIC 4121]